MYIINYFTHGIQLDFSESEYQDLIISMMSFGFASMTNLVKYIITSPYYLGKQIYTSYIERRKYKSEEWKDYMDWRTNKERYSQEMIILVKYEIFLEQVPLKWTQNTRLSFLEMLEVMGTTNLELLKSKVLEIEEEQIHYFTIKKTQLIDQYKQAIKIYETTTLPQLRNQIVNTRPFLTPDQETLVTNTFEEFKREIQAEIASAKTGYRFEIDQIRQVNNELEEKNKRLEDLVKKQAEDIVQLKQLNLSFRSSDNKKILETNKIISDQREALRLEQQITLTYHNEKVSLVAENNDLLALNNNLQKIITNIEHTSAQELIDIKKELAKQTRECKILIEKREAFNKVISEKSIAIKELEKQNSILVQTTAAMTENASIYIYEISALLKESYQELIEVNRESVKKRELIINLTQQWIIQEDKLGLLRKRHDALDQEIITLTLEKAKYTDLNKLKNSATQSGELITNLNTVNVNLNKRLEAFKKIDNEIILGERAKEKYKHTIDTHASELREETLSIEIKLIKIGELLNKIDQPAAFADNVQKVQELQASTTVSPYIKQLMVNQTAQDIEEAGQYRSDLFKSIISEWNPPTTLRSHIIDEPLLAAVIPRDTKETLSHPSTETMQKGKSLGSHEDIIVSPSNSSNQSKKTTNASSLLPKTTSKQSQSVDPATFESKMDNLVMRSKQTVPNVQPKVIINKNDSNLRNLASSMAVKDLPTDTNIHQVDNRTERTTLNASGGNKVPQTIVNPQLVINTTTTAVNTPRSATATSIADLSTVLQD
jgi:hypothetical protein